MLPSFAAFQSFNCKTLNFRPGSKLAGWTPSVRLIMDYYNPTAFCRDDPGGSESALE
jgi:hypothetical protein